MRANLVHEGWKPVKYSFSIGNFFLVCFCNVKTRLFQVKYLPAGWLVFYYKPTNGFHYMSDQGRFFNSAKRVIDFLTKNNYNPQIAKDVKTNMVESKKFTGAIKYKWMSGGTTLPNGWKRRTTKGTGRNKEEVEFILSADGVQFKSRFEALHYMIANKYKQEEVDELRKRLLLSNEKWKTHNLLPKDWIWKWIGDNSKRDKSASSTTFTLMSKEGEVIHSMKAAMERMKKDPKYTDKDVDNCKEFLRSVVCFGEKKYTWKEGDESLPKGWKSRLYVKEEEEEKERDGVPEDLRREYILSPEGLTYRTRFIALVDMFKRGCSQEDIEVMKVKMVHYENWEKNSLLPTGWMFKKVSEGWTKDKKWYSTLHYLSREGKVFESMKNVLLHIQNTAGYSKQDKENCKEFMQEQKPADIKYEWKEGGESVPKGWKTRVSDSEGEWEWILSPDVRMFRSRVLAAEDMVRRGCKKEEVEEMKEKMAFEGWQKDPHFPEGWLVKKWEGKTRHRGKLNHDLKFFSREGERLESFKMVLEAMSSSPDYTKEDEEAVKKFREQWSISQRVTGFKWEACTLTLPEGWKKRRGKGKLEAEMVLSPGGLQFRSRYNALLSMYKDGSGEKEIAAMRSKLQFEGWETEEFLPDGWLYKRTWEGLISSGSFSTNTVYISREGNVFESVKLAVEFMESMEEYKEKDIEQLKAFQAQLSRVTTKRREDWVESDTVPPGWKVRPGCGKEAGKEWVLRPDGRQFMTRCIALQYLAKEGADQEDIDLLRNSLVHEGWKKDNLLPKDWLFKVKEGKLGSTNGYKMMCKEGQLLESAKAAMDYIQVDHRDQRQRASYLQES